MQRSLSGPGEFRFDDEPAWRPIDVDLAVTGRVVFEDVWARGEADGRARVDVALSAPVEVRCGWS